MVKLAQVRRPGRPSSADASDVRSALLTAARETIVDLGYDAASTKQIADRAGVNPAMISYYFGSKAALGEAAFRETIGPLVERLDSLADRNGDDAFDFLRAYMTTLAAHPWIPQIIVREVLPERGRFRDVFISEVAARGASLLPQKLIQAQQDGTISADFDPRLAAISLASLAVFPFLLAETLRSSLGVDLTDSSTIENFTRHTEALLRVGLSPGSAATGV